MITFFTKSFPLREVVGALFLDVCLGVGPMYSMEFLCDGVLDFHSLDLLV